MAADLFTPKNEVPGSRRYRTIQIGRLVICRYNLAPKHGTLPSRGELMEGESGLLGMRLLDYSAAGPAPQGQIQYVVQWIDPEAYASASATTYQELRGSRKTGESARHHIAYRIGVASDLVNVPVDGELYPSDTNTVTGKRCIGGTRTDLTTVPGLYFCTSVYMSIRTR